MRIENTFLWLLFIWTGLTPVAWAQISQDQVNRNAINAMRNDELIRRASGRNQDAAQRRAQEKWQAEEDAIQAKIAKYRVTPYYGSVAVDPASPGYPFWGGGGKVTKELAEKTALEACGKPGCVIVATIFNGCLGSAKPDFISIPNQWTLIYDKDPAVALQRAGEICSKKYGAERCVYGVSRRQVNRPPAFCTGYDYEAYNQTK